MTDVVRFSRDGSSPIVLGEVESIQCNPDSIGWCEIGMAYAAVSTTEVYGDRIFSSRPDRNEIRILDDDGHLVGRIRGSATAPPVTEVLRNELVDAAVAADPSRERVIRSEQSFSETVPAFLNFRIRNDGYIWTREYWVEAALVRALKFPPRTAPTRWTVYDPDGVQLGDVEVPWGLTVWEIGENYVLGSFRGALGVESVRLYALEKP
jgi:hypothetical protein